MGGEGQPDLEPGVGSHSEPAVHLMISSCFVQAARATTPAPPCPGHVSHDHELDHSLVLSSWAHMQSSVA